MDEDDHLLLSGVAVYAAQRVIAARAVQLRRAERRVITDADALPQGRRAAQALSVEGIKANIVAPSMGELPHSKPG